MSSSESYKRIHSITLKSGEHIKGENKTSTTLNTVQKQQIRSGFRGKCSGSPLLCVACGLTTELYIQDSETFTYSEIQQANDDFS